MRLLILAQNQPLSLTQLTIAALVVAVIALLLAFSALSRSKRALLNQAAPAAASPAATATTPAAGPDQAVVAAISAAVYLMLETQAPSGTDSPAVNPAVGFRIRSIRRV